MGDFSTFPDRSSAATSVEHVKRIGELVGLVGINTSVDIYEKCLASLRSSDCVIRICIKALDFDVAHATQGKDKAKGAWIANPLITESFIAFACVTLSQGPLVHSTNVGE
jgi:hypothetical protein